MGMAVDLLSGDSVEIQRLNISKSLKRGKLPANPGEILISDEFATKLNLEIGDMVTLLTSTMYGSMAFQNFSVSGTVEFGIGLLDRGAIIADITDIQTTLDMVDAAGEILGYFPNGLYNDSRAEEMAIRFNGHYTETEDIYAPVMVRLRDQNDLSALMDYMKQMIGLFNGIFILAMSIVLWNAGLLSALRRYGEIGVRLAMGETKRHVYGSMIYEAIAIGLIGSVIGTLIGLLVAYFLQTTGVDISRFMKNATMMLPNVFRAHITFGAFYIGFIPGILSTVLGTMLSGIGIYKRQTANLFKELEV